MMDEDSKELAEIVVGKMLEPTTDAVTTVFGILGVDYLKEVRKRNADKFARKTAEILKERNVKDAAPPPPSILLPLISAAENEGRDELVDIWARLMAAASDPSKLGLFRRDYIEIAKQFEPIDAVVLKIIHGMTGDHRPSRLMYVAQQLSLSPDQITVAFNKLEQLRVIMGSVHSTTAPVLTPLGNQFMTVLGH